MKCVSKYISCRENSPVFDKHVTDAVDRAVSRAFFGEDHDKEICIFDFFCMVIELACEEDTWGNLDDS